MRTKQDAARIVQLLAQAYPMSICSLEYAEPWHLMVAVRLSAQCTDERVNRITPALFERFPTLQALAEGPLEDVEAIIKPCGFYHGKARDLMGAAAMLLREYGGRLPDDMDALLRLPGVGRKSANLLLGDVYHTPGVVVADTHCIRLANRLGFVQSKDPVKVETALRKVLPPEESSDFCHRCVLHGRAVCTARKALCAQCVLADVCPKKGVAAPTAP